MSTANNRRNLVSRTMNALTGRSAAAAANSVNSAIATNAAATANAALNTANAAANTANAALNTANTNFVNANANTAPVNANANANANTYFVNANAAAANVMTAPQAHHYNTPMTGIKMWYSHEMEAVGHLASMSDEYLRRMYASKVVSGMNHLAKALQEKIDDDGYAIFQREFELMKANVENAMNHLKAEYDVSEDNITYKWNVKTGGRRKARKTKATRKGKGRKARKVTRKTRRN
jgi:hypothetical protein